jgi:hypothetical protein
LNVGKLVKDAALPLGANTSVPITNPKFVLAPDAVIAQVQPLVIGTVQRVNTPVLSIVASPLRLTAVAMLDQLPTHINQLFNVLERKLDTDLANCHFASTSTNCVPTHVNDFNIWVFIFIN